MVVVVVLLLLLLLLLLVLVLVVMHRDPREPVGQLWWVVGCCLSLCLIMSTSFYFTMKNNIFKNYSIILSIRVKNKIMNKTKHK